MNFKLPMLNITIPSIPKEIIEKAISGRYYLTIVGGIAFLYSTWKRILPAEAVAAIITMVFINYFQRDRNKENGVPK